jgi:hypothetical protein
MEINKKNAENREPCSHGEEAARKHVELPWRSHESAVHAVWSRQEFMAKPNNTETKTLTSHPARIFGGEIGRRRKDNFGHAILI